MISHVIATCRRFGSNIKVVKALSDKLYLKLGQMSLRSNVSWAQFQAGELIREVWWRRERIENDIGVLVYCSNDHSDHTLRAAEWSVFFMKEADSGYLDASII